MKKQPAAAAALPTENIWYDALKVKRPTKIVDFPRYDANKKPVTKIALRTLVHEDHIKIQRDSILEADRRFKSLEKELDRSSPEWRGIHENISAKHYLFEATRHPDNPALPFFPTPDSIGTDLTNDEISILLMNHKTFQQDRGTIIATMTPDELESHINKLSEASEESAYFLDRFSSEALFQLIASMASRLRTLQTAKSAPTSQASDTSSER